jgi:3-oxoacyl-[acyl-carrier protein] reductase
MTSADRWAGAFAGKTVLVTGGGSGIGKSIATAFARAGASVVVAGRGRERIETVARDIGGRAAVTDVASEQSVKALFAGIAQNEGGLDVLINNAGVNLARSPVVGDVREEEWSRVLDVNLSGTLHCTQAVLPLMAKRGGGRIVNFSSVLALAGFPGQSAYAASKAGILGLTRVWARELGPRGITVNAVVPGYIETAMNNASAADFRRAVVARTALRRLGAPGDVARVCLFLASDDAAFVTGVALPVDGGLVG